MDCVNFFIFLIWFLNFFFPNNLVLIKNQLILISYEMVELKKMDQNKKKKKRVKYWWRAIRFAKDTL
jgi:hypothetical protein